MKSGRQTKVTFGFTLLEVLIAIAILALGVVALFQSQASSLRMAQAARTLTVATQLARAKLFDCRFDLIKKGFGLGSYDESGDFSDDDFPDYEWECHAYPFEIPLPNQDQIQQGMKAGQKGDTGAGASMSASMLAPFFNLISPAFKNSVRELILIVRWKEGEATEELKVVTHVVNREPLALLLRQLPDQPQIPGLPGQNPPTQAAPPQQQGQPEGGRR
jgi:general secretion pathway protein I